jgi:hypothetical protein
VASGALRLKPRIPIFDTIGQGFYFGLTRYFSILKITWLPAVLAGAVVAFQLSAQLLSQRGQLKSFGNLPDYFVLIGWIPFYALLSIPAVAAYRMAVYGRKAPGGIAYFKFGGTELQFVAAQLVTSVYLMIYTIFALALVVGAALFGYHFLGPTEAMAATAAPAVDGDLTLRLRLGSGAVAIFLSLVFFGWIFLSLVQPIVVAEHRIGVWKSLRLLWLGNGLRLAIVWAVVGLTFLFFSTVVAAGLQAYGPRILYLLMPEFNQKNIGHLVFGWTLLILVPAILLGVLLLGVTAGVNGSVYRILALHPKGEPAK